MSAKEWCLIKIIQRLQWLQENKLKITTGEIRDDLYELAEACKRLGDRLFI
jgi:hypothetical protein